MESLRIKMFKVDGSQSVIDKIERAYEFSFDRFRHIIREAETTLIDENGPKGGVDKKCSLHLRLLPRGIIVAHGNGESPVAAFNEAVDKAIQLLKKRLGKQRKRHPIDRDLGFYEYTHVN